MTSEFKYVFIAEIKQTKQHKTVSADNEYSIRFITDDSKIMDLGKLDPQQVVKVTVESG